LSDDIKLLSLFTIVGFSMILIGITINIVEMKIDHNCYQLEPNDNYNKTICEKYWKEK